ncbi:hypothetical protein BaRGS_00027632 [Batillaria attramentaria]|uniref:Major facilitator superfamily (MFS) profile domain-containing protein n=1 Tax=Batillaria attramentaria TaxID=370345 RepID=A0ABD0K201_9CAEN
MAVSWDEKELRRLDVDEVWRALGRFGRYQLLQLLVFSFTNVPLAFHVLSVVFQGASNPHTCRPPPEFLGEDGDAFNGTVTMETCRIELYDNVTGAILSETSSCDGYAYKNPSYISFWDLVCDRAPLAQLSQTLVMAGMFVGASCVAPFADRYGRKTVHVGCHVLLLCVAIGMAFMPSYPGYMVLKFLAGMTIMGMCVPVITHQLEMYPRELRAAVGQFTSVLWAVSIMCMTPMAYFTRHYSWRTMQIVFAAFNVFSFLEIFLLDESLRWLVANQRFKDIERIIRKASRLNGRDPDFVLSASLAKADAKHADGNDAMTGSDVQPVVDKPVALISVVDGDKDDHKCAETDDLMNEKEKEADKALVKRVREERREGLLDLLKDSDMRFITLANLYIWMTTSMTYYGITLLSSSLFGSPYINFFLGGFLEIPGTLLMMWGLYRIGRKKTIIIFISVAWISLLAATLVAVLGDGGTAASSAQTALSLAGRFGIATVFHAIWIYTPELFPTNLRSIGVGLASSGARVGGMLSPFFKLLSDLALWTPGAVFCGLCLLATVLLVLLPETTHRPLATSIQDVKAWRRQDRKQNDEFVVKVN